MLDAHDGGMTDDERDEGHVGSTPKEPVRVTAWVEFDEPDPEDGGRPVARVFIEDGAHPGLQATMSYLMSDLGQSELIGFSVASLLEDRPGFTPVRLGPGLIKDLPMARWDRVGQAALSKALMERSLAAVSVPLTPAESQAAVDIMAALNEKPDSIATPLHVSFDRRHRAMEMVRRVRPDLDPHQSRGSARSYNGLIKLAEALDEYTELLASGSADPVGEMASAHGVALPTVRTWLHRARQAGLTAGLLPESASENIGLLSWARRGPGVDRSLTPEEAGTGGRPGGGLDGFEEIGQILQRARVEAGMSLEELAKATRVRSALIAEIESGNLKAVGGDVFVRGHIRTLARALKIDAYPLVEKYDTIRKFQKERSERKGT